MKANIAFETDAWSARLPQALPGAAQRGRLGSKYEIAMAGYIYCMKNDHRIYGTYLKIGYTERTPELRRLELCQKWRCAFEVIWDIDVYDPVKAERFIHAVLDRFRVDHEFFSIEVEALKALAEKYFDEHWREVEGKEVLPADLVELVKHGSRGLLLESNAPRGYDPELDEGLGYPPDSDSNS